MDLFESTIYNYLKDNNREFGNNSKKIITYFTGVVSDNPSGSVTNISKIEYYNDLLLILTDSFKYNTNDCIIEQNTIYNV